MLVVVSGWMDRLYLTMARKLVKKKYIVVVCFDQQWSGGLKQYFFSFFSKYFFRKYYFTHAWVCGINQYYYAKKLGFKNNEIIFDLYSADLPIFQKVYNDSKEKKHNKYPHKFFFVGRLVKSKGLDTLLKAWQLIVDERNDWELVIIGTGPLRQNLLGIESVRHIDFLQPSRLIDEITNAGCFILPSTHEPWGVVVHEFAASGLPLILSNAVGSSKSFLIDGFNGYSFASQDSHSLSKKMLQIINSTHSDLLLMGKNSYVLSNRITPVTSANNILSILISKI